MSASSTAAAHCFAPGAPSPRHRRSSSVRRRLDRSSSATMCRIAASLRGGSDTRSVEWRHRAAPSDDPGFAGERRRVWRTRAVAWSGFPSNALSAQSAARRRGHQHLDSIAPAGTGSENRRSRVGSRRNPNSLRRSRCLQRRCAVGAQSLGRIHRVVECESKCRSPGACRKQAGPRSAYAAGLVGYGVPSLWANPAIFGSNTMSTSG
jgi:hypothetical protein